METLGNERYTTGPVDKKNLLNNPARIDSAYDSISGKSFQLFPEDQYLDFNFERM